jgi:di/tricarboxylate transporter
MDDAKLGQDHNITVLELYRSKMPSSAALLSEGVLDLYSGDFEKIPVEAKIRFETGDILVVQGKPNDVSHAAAIWNLGVIPAQTEVDHQIVTEEVGLAEVLLPPRSSLVGKTIVDTRFGSQHNLTVLGIQRPGIEDSLDIKNTPLRFGDTLLVQGPWNHILALREKRRDFVVMGEPEQMVGAPTRKKAPIALIIMAGMLILMIFSIVPVATASLLAALLMIVTGCLSIDEAYESVDWKSIVLIAGMLPMSIALSKVGLVDLVSQAFINSLGVYGPTFVLAGLFILTSAFTQVLSNTTTTVLIAPIALVSAERLGVEPYAFMMGIAIAASMAFATPVASPVNTLVMGAGAYRFSDYARVGVPLILLMLLISLIVLPFIWPY